jgi:Protein of unknown function (DUF2510)
VTNAPPPGWHPDPTARHGYRYWDGSQWTDDVADGDVTAVDPLTDLTPGSQSPAADDSAGASGDQGSDATNPTPAHPPTAEPGAATAADSPGQPTAAHPPTVEVGAAGDQDTTVAQPADAPTAAHPSGPPTMAYPPTPAATSGDRWASRPDGHSGPPDGPTGRPPRKGPPARLLVGIGLVAVALVAGLVFALTSSDGDEPSAGGTEIGDGGGSGGDDRTETGGDATATTAPSDGDGDGQTTAPDDGGDDGRGGSDGGLGEIDTSSEEAAIESVAELLQETSGGTVSDEAAQCAAEGLVDEIGLDGVERLMSDAPQGGESLLNLSPDDIVAVQRVLADCGVLLGGGGG